MRNLTCGSSEEFLGKWICGQVSGVIWWDTFADPISSRPQDLWVKFWPHCVVCCTSARTSQVTLGAGGWVGNGFIIPNPSIPTALPSLYHSHPGHPWQSTWWHSHYLSTSPHLNTQKVVWCPTSVTFLDAIASPSSYPCGSVGGW